MSSKRSEDKNTHELYNNYFVGKYRMDLVEKIVFEISRDSRVYNCMLHHRALATKCSILFLL